MLKFHVAVLCSTAFIITAFGLSYFFWGHDGLPIGWDTPHYIEESRIVASQGPAALLAIQGPYDVVYPLLSGLLARSGVSAITLEIYLPVALAAMFPYLLSRLPLINQDVRTATAVAVGTPGWYAIYDIAGDKHANLLGLVFILAALPLLFRTKSIRQSQGILGLILIGIASFTHVETTLFFVTVIIISSVALSIFPTRIAFLAAAVTLPATVIYISRVFQLVGLIGFSLPVVNLEPVLFWLEVFGPLLPLAIYGLLAPIIGRRSRLEAFTVIWASCSLLIGISQYFNGQAYIFAQRAATIVPASLLAAVGLMRLRSWAGKLRPDKPGLERLQKGVLMAGFILLLASWPVTYLTVGYQNHRVFLASSAYQRLEWISNNMRFANTPIFVYNDLDPNAGGRGDLYSNWVGAIVGRHLSYLGRMDYLAQIQQTPFSDIISRWQSAIFMKQIYDTGITNRTILFEHPIILVEDFYNPFPLPTYVAGFFHNVSDGVFEGDNARLATLYNMTLPLSSSLINSVGPWHTTQRSWAQSIYALEAKVNSTPTDLEASFLLGIPRAGSYSLGFRYWDGTGNDLEVVLDGATVGTVHYNGTGAPLIGNFTGVYLTSGLHNVSVKIGQNRAFQQYASLDYLVVSRL